MTDEDRDDDWDYESGPFCRHWSDLGYCEEICARCGHTCNQHDVGDVTCDECECDEFVDAPEPAPTVSAS